MANKAVLQVFKSSEIEMRGQILLPGQSLINQDNQLKKKTQICSIKALVPGHVRTFWLQMT